jgi:hypothetical protein
MVTATMASSWLAFARLEQHRIAEAQAVLDGASTDPAIAGASSVLRVASGAIRHAQLDFSGAATEFETAGALLLRNAAPCPALLPWRSRAACAHAARGDHAAARARAEEEHELARRFGSSASLGIALGALAAVGPAERRLPLQRAAVDALERSPARLAYGQALCDLGATLRRARAGVEARAPLRMALDGGVRCGAGRLIRRARQELAPSGARPRRVVVEGRHALTPAELKVSNLRVAPETTGQLHARTRTELPVDAVEMALDGPWGDEQRRRHLTVGRAIGDEERDLELLRREPVGGRAHTATSALTRRRKLACRLLLPRTCAELAQGLARSSQPLARLGAAACAA